ncbi:hypothetical protein D3C75_1265650 [compost metagenome]
MQEGIGWKRTADGVEGEARGGFAFDPEISRGHFVASFQDGCGQVQLAIQLQGPRLHREGSGGGAGADGFIDDAH